MSNHTIFNAVRRSFLLLALAMVAGHAAAATAYHVEIDSTSLSGTGWLDLQFNPGAFNATDATATLSGFTGSLDNTQSNQVTGNVIGNLPATLMFDNHSAYNDLFQAVVFGGKFSFNLSFGGDFLSTPGSVGSSFAASLYAADQVTPLGAADAATGSLVRFDATPAAANQLGKVNVTVFDSAFVQISAVPEPASYAMFLLGLAFLGGTVARRKNQA